MDAHMHVEVGKWRVRKRPAAPLTHAAHLDGKGDVRLRVAARSSNGEVHNVHLFVTSFRVVVNVRNRP